MVIVLKFPLDIRNEIKTQSFCNNTKRICGLWFIYLLIFFIFFFWEMTPIKDSLKQKYTANLHFFAFGGRGFVAWECLS